MELFLAHCLGLLWLSLGAARRFTHRTGDQLLAAALLAWGNIVVTSLLLAVVLRLGEHRWFFLLSLGLAGLTCLLALRLPAESPLPPDEPSERGPAAWLQVAFVVTIVPAALASIAIAWTYEPNNPESLACHLPRAAYYLGQNSLAHFDAADLRQTHLPFNYDLLQLFGLVYGPPLQCLNLFNLVAWASAGIAVYRLCRLGAVGANISLITCWLVIVTPPVIAQATSATPELPAGVALLGALNFAWQWRQTGRIRYAILGALGMGLSAGSDSRVLLFGAAIGLLALGWGCRPARRGGMLPVLRAWIVPGLLAGVLALPFAVINVAQAGPEPRSFPWLAVKQPVGDAPDVWAGFLPLLRQSSPPEPLNEDVAGFGFTGLLFLMGAIVGLVRHRQFAGPAAWCTWLGLGWIVIHLCPPWGPAPSPRDLIPALLLLSPAVAALLAAGRNGPRPAGLLLVAVVALATGWSAGVYLLKNTSRPLIPLLNAAFAPPALPTLPLLMDHYLTKQSRINVDTDGVNERIFPFLAQRPQQRATSRHQPDPDAYNLFSRSTGSRTTAFVDLARRPAFTLIPIPSKRTAGVEFLATIGTGPDARDYFGLGPHSDRTAPIDSNRCLLVTLYPSPTDATHTLIRLAGLNPADHARLAINLEYDDRRVAPLTVFDGDGDVTVSIPSPFRQLAFRVLDAASGGEIGATAISYQSRSAEPAEPIDPRLPTSSRSIFVTDLVLAKGAQAISVDGLLPVEGPFPQWDLPYLRWQREPVARIRIPAGAQLAHLQLSFSVRLHVRKKAALDVRFNGKLVQRYRIDHQSIWVDQTVELTPRPGENVLEFQDAPLNHEPDWLGYLDLYPDVKKHVAVNHLNPEEGARTHYELHGRPEGRTLPTIEKPEPAPDGYYFMYRNIRLEGFKSP